VEGIVDEVEIGLFVMLQAKGLFESCAYFDWQIQFCNSRVDVHSDVVPFQQVDVLLRRGVCRDAYDADDQIALVVWGEDEGEVVGDETRGIVAAESETPEHGLVVCAGIRGVCIGRLSILRY
jgi:hypothetical protein